MTNNLKTGAFLLVCALFIAFSTINLNAEITVKKVWDPPTRSIAPHSRVPFIQVEIKSDTTEPLQYLRLDRVGNTEFVKVFKRIVAVDGFSRVITSVEGITLYAEPVFLYFHDTVIQAGESLFITLAGDVKDSTALQPENGKAIGLSVGEIRFGNTETATGIAFQKELSGATHTVDAGLQIGTITGFRSSIPTLNAEVGKGRDLGSLILFVSSGESIRALPSFRVYSSKMPSVQNLLVGVENNKGISWVGVVRPVFGSDGESSSLDTTEYVTLTSGINRFHFRGDVGMAFSSGDTIAISTAPFAWRAKYGETSVYDIPTDGFGTVVGPTVTVRGPRLDVSVKAPSYSWVGADQLNLTVLTIVLDARESSEDIAVTGLPFWYMTAPEWKNDVKKAGYFDGDSDLPGTGTLHGNASSEWITAWSESYPEALRVPKGTLKELQLKIDLAPTASGYYGFGILDGSNFRVTGTETGFNPVVNLRPGWHIIRASQGKG